MKRARTSDRSRRKLPIDWESSTGFKVPIPKDEPERLKDLRRHQILDTMPEDDFDSITLLASQICNTPIAVISLVDSDRQWFKSRVGLSLSETSRDIAFCAHAIMQPDLFIIPDASKDQRFTRNPLVRDEPKIRFYAGAPLISSDDHALGTLCVMDRQPRELTSGQKAALRTLSRAVMNQLEMRRRLMELEEKNRQNHGTSAKRALRSGSHQAARLSHAPFLRKAAHEVSAAAGAIVTVIQRALQQPCTPEQNDLLRTARASAGSLQALAGEMKKAATLRARTA